MHRDRDMNCSIRFSLIYHHSRIAPQSLSELSHVLGAVDKTSSSFSAHGKIGNFIIIIPLMTSYSMVTGGRCVYNNTEANSGPLDVESDKLTILHQHSSYTDMPTCRYSQPGTSANRVGMYEYISHSLMSIFTSIFCKL